MSSPTVYRAVAIDLILTAGGSTFTVKQDCMSPAIRAGNRVRIERCSPDSLRRGDVVLLHQDARLTLHRYLGAWQQNGEPYLLCKADTRRRPDRPWSEIALVGRVVEVRSVPASRWQCSEIERLSLGTFYLTARAGIASGIFPAAAPREAEAVVRVAALLQTWTIHLRAPRARGAELIALRNELRAIPFAESGAITRDANITVQLADSVPVLAKEKRQALPEILVATDRLLVRLPEDAPGGEIMAQDVTAARAGLEAVFRQLAMRACAARGGIALHAAAALADDGALYLFAGASGAGKSTAAATFGQRQQVDRDFVCLLPQNGQYTRVPVFPFRDSLADENATPSASQIIRSPSALLLPMRGEGIEMERLNGAAAVRACLHRPPEPLSPAVAESLIECSIKLAAQIPVCRLRWSREADLPAALREKFPCPQPPATTPDMDP